jgi:glutathione S-transferase
MSLALVVGNKNYSSWSLRAWLALRHFGLEFDEIHIKLDQPDTNANILVHTPSGRVPCLLDGEITVWDSLAICEYVNDNYLYGGMWPRGREARAHARAVVCEMHSGFMALRTHMSMDIRSRLPDKGREALRKAEVAADVARIQAIWTGCLQRFGGPLLFGNFSVADAYFAPVVTRFATYAVPMPAPLMNYANEVLELPAMQQWVEAAHAEPEVLYDH